MKTAQFEVTVQITVEVEDEVSIKEAEEIALFNVEPIIGSINSDLNRKMLDIEMGSYQVHSSEFVD